MLLVMPPPADFRGSGDLEVVSTALGSMVGILVP